MLNYLCGAGDEELLDCIQPAVQPKLRLAVHVGTKVCSHLCGKIRIQPPIHCNPRLAHDEPCSAMCMKMHHDVNMHIYIGIEKGESLMRAGTTTETRKLQRAWR